MRVGAPFEKRRGGSPKWTASNGRQDCTRQSTPGEAAYAAFVALSDAGSTVIIAVGDEILSGHTLDTNSHLLARLAFAAGRPVSRIEVVGDRMAAIVGAIRRAVEDLDVRRIAVCGGIGPTPDDRTFQAVADALEHPLELNATAFDHIATLTQRMFEAGWVNSPEVSEANRRSAMIPAGAEVLVNRRGMAPPLAIDLGDDRWLFVLPGVPREFSAIVEEELMPRFFSGGTPVQVVEVRYRSVPEAEMYPPMRTLETEFPDVAVGSYPQMDRGELVIRLRGYDIERVSAAASRLRELRSD
jgi:nicotinamide-nucleotide amidase